MFCVKQLDRKKGAILTTLNYDPPRGGINIAEQGEEENGDTLVVSNLQEGTESNFITGSVYGFIDYVDYWLHVTVVWHVDKTFEIYFDGAPKNVSHKITNFDTNGASRKKMKLGTVSVTNNQLNMTKNMTLILFDEPLTLTDVGKCVLKGMGTEI